MRQREGQRSSRRRSHIRRGQCGCFRAACRRTGNPAAGFPAASLAVSGPHQFAETAATLACGGYSFTIKGKTVPIPGWKRRYAALTRREKKESDVIAYHLRQSFRPGEIDPAKANEIGYDLGMSLTKGRHAFIVCTHVDRSHIHSHIIFNSTSLDCTRKFRNFWGSSFAIRRISDTLCLENGLSVTENPKPNRDCYGTWLGDKKPLTVRGKLEQFIDAALASGYKDFDSFIVAMRTSGVEVKRRKHLAFKVRDGKRFIRCDSLGADYIESAIYERISGKSTVALKQRAQQAAVPAKPNLLIDIQAKLQQANSPGFERWVKVYNLKEMAKTLVYLEENGLDNYDALTEAADASSKKYHEISDKTKVNNERMKKIAELQKQIATYGKTREVYAQYCKLPPKSETLFTTNIPATSFCAKLPNDILIHWAFKSCRALKRSKRSTPCWKRRIKNSILSKSGKEQK